MYVKISFHTRNPPVHAAIHILLKKCVYNIMQLNIITCIFKKKLYFSDIGKVLKLKTYATNQAYSIYLKNARYDKCL